MKTHYRHAAGYLQCNAVIGPRTEATYNLGSVTCRVCMFSYLAEQAPWAREFMDKLRGADTAAKRSAGKTLQGGFRPGLGGFEEMEARVMAAGPTAFDRVNPDGMPPALMLAADFGGSVGAGAHGVPMGPATHANRPEEHLGRSLASLLSHDAVPQKAICEFLPKAEPPLTAVQVVMDYSGATAGAVGVKPSQVAEGTRDAGQVSAESNRDF